MMSSTYLGYCVSNWRELKEHGADSSPSGLNHKNDLTSSLWLSAVVPHLDLLDGYVSYHLQQLPHLYLICWMAVLAITSSFSNRVLQSCSNVDPLVCRDWDRFVFSSGRLGGQYVILSSYLYWSVLELPVIMRNTLSVTLLCKAS